jgi:hypothetical protein
VSGRILNRDVGIFRGIEWIPWEDSMSASGISDPVTPAAWAPAHTDATHAPPQSVGQAQVEHRRREANSGEPRKVASSNPPKANKVDVRA